MKIIRIIPLITNLKYLSCIILGVLLATYAHNIINSSRAPSHQDTKPVQEQSIASPPETEYKLSSKSWFCRFFEDANEFVRTLYIDKSNALYLVKSDKCFLLNTLSSEKFEKIRHVSLIDIYKPNDSRTNDMCKIRVYLNGDGVEGWTNCMVILKGKEEEEYLYPSRTSTHTLGWGSD